MVNIKTRETHIFNRRWIQLNDYYEQCGLYMLYVSCYMERLILVFVSCVYSGLESCFFFFPLYVLWTRSGLSCCSSTGPSGTLPWRSCCVTCLKTKTITHKPVQSSIISLCGEEWYLTDISFVLLYAYQRFCVLLIFF